MKKIIALVLALVTILACATTSLAVENPSRVGGSGIAYVELPIEGTKRMVQSDVFLKWHPGRSAPVREVENWYFSCDTTNYNISISASALWDAFSVTVAVENIVGNNSGCAFSIRGNPNGWSRPYIAGDVYVTEYQKGYYNFNTKTWVKKTGTKLVYSAQAFSVEIARADTKAELM